MMDIMRIESNFMKKVLSKLAKKVMFKKTGHEVGVRFNDIDVCMYEEKAQVHLDVDLELDKDELVKILKTVGLN